MKYRKKPVLQNELDRVMNQVIDAQKMAIMPMPEFAVTYEIVEE